jgi:hypothetical protein
MKLACTMCIEAGAAGMLVMPSATNGTSNGAVGGAE